MGFEERFIVEKQRVGNNCKRIRKEKKVYQHQMLALANIGATRISDIEHGKNNIEFETLYKLKKGLHINLFFLFQDSSFPVGNMQYNDISLELEKKHFSRRLAQLLEHRSISQRDLSIMIAKGEGEISNFVNGTHNIEFLSLVKIAEALQISLTILFDYSGPLPSNEGYKQAIVE